MDTPDLSRRQVLAGTVGAVGLAGGYVFWARPCGPGQVPLGSIDGSRRSDIPYESKGSVASVTYSDGTAIVRDPTGEVSVVIEGRQDDRLIELYERRELEGTCVTIRFRIESPPPTDSDRTRDYMDNITVSVAD